MSIRISITVGIFHKEYAEICGQPYLHDPPAQDADIRILMMVDSLQMTEADRGNIKNHCRGSSVPQIVITHGTDNIVETAKCLPGQVACHKAMPAELSKFDFPAKY